MRNLLKQYIFILYQNLSFDKTDCKINKINYVQGITAFCLLKFVKIEILHLEQFSTIIYKTTTFRTIILHKILLM